MKAVVEPSSAGTKTLRKQQWLGHDTLRGTSRMEVIAGERKLRLLVAGQPRIGSRERCTVLVHLSSFQWLFGPIGPVESGCYGDCTLDCAHCTVHCAPRHGCSRPRSKRRSAGRRAAAPKVARSLDSSASTRVCTRTCARLHSGRRASYPRRRRRVGMTGFDTFECGPTGQNLQATRRTV
jgi:hypothetical protein